MRPPGLPSPVQSAIAPKCTGLKTNAQAAKTVIMCDQSLEHLARPGGACRIKLASSDFQPGGPIRIETIAGCAAAMERHCQIDLANAAWSSCEKRSTNACICEIAGSASST